MDSTTAAGTPWSFDPTFNSTSPGFKSSTVAPTIFPRAGYSILSYLMFINAIFSVFNNTLVITVLVKNRTLLNPMNVIILSLAVSDLMIALCGSSIVTITNYHGSFFLGDEFCIFQGFAVNYFGLVSMCTLTLLAYERYNVVCKPMAGFKMNVRRSFQGLLGVWLFCLFWAVPPLLGWSSYGPEGVQTSCSLGWEERSWSNYSYLILYTLFCFLLPVAIIIYCYAKVLTSMRQLNRSTELQGGRPCLQDNERAVRIVLAMIGAFFVCWLPYTALSVVVVVDPELHIPPLVATMPMYFAKTSPVYNPIIYFLSNKQFRNATLEVLSCGRYIPHDPAPDTVPMRSMTLRTTVGRRGPVGGGLEELLCDTQVASFSFSCCIQLLTLACISMERHQAITHPFKITQRRRRILVWIPLTWMVEETVAAIPVPETPAAKQCLEVEGGVCMMPSFANKEHAKKKESKLAKRSGYIILTFLIFWMPLIVMMLANVFCNRNRNFRMGTAQNLEILSVSVACMTSASNPITYAVVNPQFRTEFYYLRRKCKSLWTRA
ncbi:parietopsin [Salvelinus namaycush]|uniref:Parietopsin n=1 Tax=Salvelinus namaycush TaxID=8040 RepID=A0A8U1H987_SALNM|nr:parietopsin [Salvelinus namaycush]